MKKTLFVICAFLFCCALRAEEIFFENATEEQSDFLVQFAMDSNAVYGYRTISEEEARDFFHLCKHNFEKGIVRLMKGPSGIMGFYGLARHSDKEDGAWVNLLTHLFLKPKFIGQGYGKMLFQDAMRTAREELHWEALFWESDPNAAWFYEKMGAKHVGENPCNLNPDYRAPIFVYILNP
ncbi:MAG TPA: GNAT family N-acetyltransferase [Rhabdochlamydiaceae bacterium]|nr:GNAT family N-acetyltransferase [Rhabdochlamydiaceae bacterium]